VQRPSTTTCSSISEAALVSRSSTLIGFELLFPAQPLNKRMLTTVANKFKNNLFLFIGLIYFFILLQFKDNYFSGWRKNIGSFMRKNDLFVG
jgi:hypothetical protein